MVLLIGLRSTQVGQDTASVACPRCGCPCRLTGPALALYEPVHGAEIARLTAALASAEARADKMEASLRWADAYLTDTLVHGGQIAHEWHRWWNESLRPALNAAALAEQPGDLPGRRRVEGQMLGERGDRGPA